MVKEKKFELVFSFYSHPLFGVMAEPFVVQLLENGQLSLSYQKVSEANIQSFLPGIPAHPVQLISILQKLSNQHLSRELKLPTAQLESQLQKMTAARDEKGKLLFENLKGKIFRAKHEFFRHLQGTERLFESGKDGYPAARELFFVPDVRMKMRYQFLDRQILVEPHFEDPRLQAQPIQLLDEQTPFAMAGSFIFPVPAGLKPSRLKPFSQKKSLEIQDSFTAEFSRKIIVPDLKAGLALLEGNTGTEEFPLEGAELAFSFEFIGRQMDLFQKEQAGELVLPPRLFIRLSWFYGKLKLPDNHPESSSWMFEDGPQAVFRLLKRNRTAENQIRQKIEDLFGFSFSGGEAKIGFALLRDQVLNQLDHLPGEVSYRFSPEFGQLSMKKIRLHFNVFEKINYFEIEGKIDWDDGEMDFIRLRSQFSSDQGWLKIAGRFFPLEEEDHQFLEQLMLVSTGKEQLQIPRTTALALKENPSGIFSGRWDRLTSVLQKPDLKDLPDARICSPNFTLRAYQLNGLNWFAQLSANGFGGILADDMGLGKTFQAAAFLRFLKTETAEKSCALIVVPSTLLFNWKEELSRFSPDFSVCIHHGPNRTNNLEAVFRMYDVVLVSYQTLLRDAGLFAGLPFSTLIADEAQHLKNPSAAVYQAVKNLSLNRVFLLTGTPLQNSPADIWALSELCNPGLMSSRIKPASLQKNENPARFRKNLELMQALMRPFLLRRTKESVLSELPEKTISVLHCGMAEEQEMEYLACNQLLSSQISDLALSRRSGHNVRILKALTTLRQMANHPAMLDSGFTGKSGKFELIKEKLHEVLEEGRKVLIFSSFVRHLQLLENYLLAENLDYACLTGQTGDRKAEVEKFRQNPDCRIFLISLKAGGFGLNLVEASCVFILDPWWNPAAEMQAIDRVHRIGQKDRVTVYKFITVNTVEEKIIKLQEQKSAMNEQLFSDGEGPDGSGAMSIELLQSILMTKV
jgi:superfamily II DNA or RNA helicase